MTPDWPKKENPLLFTVAHIVGDFSRQPVGMKTIRIIKTSSDPDSEEDKLQKKDILDPIHNL